MAFGTLSFATMILLVRKSSATFSAFEIAFWRAAFGLVLLAPWLVRTRFQRLKTKHPMLHFHRNFIHLLGVVAWFYAVARINLSEAVALQFTVPLFTIALAIVFLKERVDPQRWAATAIGFSGVLIVLRPGVVEVSPAALLTIAAAALYAASNVLTKIIGRTDPSDTVVFYMHLVHLPFAFAGAVVVGWVTPGWADLPWLAGVAIAASAAHFFLAQAFREADASLVIPIDFLKLPWVTVLAYFIFAETPTVWAWLGGMVIFGATYDIVRREARLGRGAGTAGG